MATSKSMTHGNPIKLITTFAFPILLGSIFQLIYSIVDSAVVGRMIGVEAFAAVGAAGNLNWMVFSIVLGLTQGFGTVIAQFFGANDIEKVRKSFAMSLLLSAAVGLVLSIVTASLAHPVLHLLQTPDEILSDASAYLQIMFGGMFITFMYNSLGSALRAVGNSRIPFYALILSSVLNVVLDILFVKITPWGVAAVAIATLISQVVSCVYCLLYIKRVEVLRLHKEDFAPDKKIIINHIRLGGPMGFRNFVIALGGTITQFYVNGYGTEFIAGISATKRMYSIIELVSVSMEGAVATFTAQNYGARRMDRIKQGVIQSAVVLLVGAGVIMAVMFAFGRNIISLLITGEPEQVGRILDIAFAQLSLMLLFLPALHLLVMFRSALQGMDNALMPMVSGFVEMVTRLLAVFTLPKLLGQQGIYLTEVLPWPAAMIVLAISFVVVYRKRCAAFAEIQAEDADGL